MAFIRFMLVVAVFALWIGGISIRLVNLQITQHAWLKEKALDNRQDVKQTQMLRGTIYDRNGRALAMSLRAKTLYADSTEIEDPAATAKVLAKVLKLDANQIAAQIKIGKEKRRRFVPIAKKLDGEAEQRINRALDIPGVKKFDLPNFTGLHWREDQKRSYPYQSLAAQVVGFSNASDDGKAGIEQSQDDILHGAIIKKYQERDRLGRIYDETIEERDTPSDIVLTIDSAYQYMTETALERGVKAANARSGMAIVMSPKTGEVLALANYPTFDPNTITEAVTDNIGNKAIQSIYSPGSVFKIVAYGSGLEKHLFRPNDLINAGNGSITVAKHTFSDHHTGSMTYADALGYSSNVCAIKTGMAVGRDGFFDMVQKMGFGKKTGIELPAETAGIVRSPEVWAGDSLASMSIGYEIGVTALQMTTAFATIANNGLRIQPHIIKEIRHSNGEPKTVTEPSQTQVVSLETAQDLRTMMREVVQNGTGRKAQLDGYTVAGKTGTAWKFNAKSKTVDSSKYISSFIGMAPANDPEIVVAVVMDEPKGGGRDGGTVSAPVFSEIAQNILTEMKVPTDSNVKRDDQLAAGGQKPVTGTESNKNLIDEAPTGSEKTKPVVSQPPAENDASVKEKKRETNNTKDKRGAHSGKLTASMTRKYYWGDLAQAQVTKIET